MSMNEVLVRSRNRCISIGQFIETDSGGISGILIEAHWTRSEVVGSIYYSIVLENHRKASWMRRTQFLISTEIVSLDEALLHSCSRVRSLALEGALGRPIELKADFDLGWSSVLCY